MKKVTFLLIPLLAYGQLAFCQNSFGLKAGLNLANQHNTFTPSWEHSIQPASFTGYQFGFFYKARLSKKWNISSEVSYSLIGSKEDYVYVDNTQPSGLGTGQSVNRMGYLNFPLTLEYSIHRLYFGIGPIVGFNLSSKNSYFGSNSHYRLLDVGSNIVGGYKITKRIAANLSYCYGLINILKDQSKYGGGKYVTTKNRVLSLSILYSLK